MPVTHTILIFIVKAGAHLSGASYETVGFQPCPQILFKVGSGWMVRNTLAYYDIALIRPRESYSQHFIFFVAYQWAQLAEAGLNSVVNCNT